jgi:hypothetical protein
MTASFDPVEYEQAEDDGDTPLACDCCENGALIPVVWREEEEDE